MPHSEADTRAKVLNPALYARGWKEDNLKREATVGAVETRDGNPGNKRLPKFQVGQSCSAVIRG